MVETRYLFDDEPSPFASVAAWRTWLQGLRALPKQDDPSVVDAIRHAEQVIADKTEAEEPAV